MNKIYKKAGNDRVKAMLVADYKAIERHEANVEYERALDDAVESYKEALSDITKQTDQQVKNCAETRGIVIT